MANTEKRMDQTENPYFWQRDGICLRTFEETDRLALERILLQTESRMEEERGISLPSCEQDAELLMEWVKEQTGQIWLAIADETDRMAGYTVLRNIDERNGNADVYLTVLPEFRRKGYASATLGILCDYAFKERRLHKLCATVIQGNEAAEGFLSDFGMLRECVKKEMIFLNGAYRDEYCYGLTKEEYDFQTAGEKARGAEDKRCDESAGPDGDTDLLKSREVKTAHTKKERTETQGNRPDFWHCGDIRLRALTVADCVFLNGIRHESGACRMFNDDVMLPGDGFCIHGFDEEHTDFENADGRTVFAVENDRKKCVGAIQLFATDRKNGTFSFSIYIAGAYRQKGYGAKALHLLLEYGFRQQRFHKCNTVVNEENTASLGLMKSLGFVYEGTQRDMVYYNGNYVNKIHLGMTEEGFE